MKQNLQIKDYEQFQQRSLWWIRKRHYLALFIVGFCMWVNYLFGFVIDLIKKIDTFSDYWIYNFFFDTKFKLYPIVAIYDILSTTIFIGSTLYSIHWIRYDVMYKTKYQKKVTPFKNLLIRATIINIVTYVILWLGTEKLLAYYG